MPLPDEALSSRTEFWYCMLDGFCIRAQQPALPAGPPEIIRESLIESPAVVHDDTALNGAELVPSSWSHDILRKPSLPERCSYVCQWLGCCFVGGFLADPGGAFRPAYRWAARR